MVEFNCTSTKSLCEQNVTRLGRSTLLLNSEAPEQMTAESYTPFRMVPNLLTSDDLERSSNQGKSLPVSLILTSAMSPIDFYHATRMNSADYAVARCLSVSLSHAGIESKRLYISSKFFHHRVAPPF